MRRRLLNVLTVLSLLLCMAVCVLWVRSYWVADSLWKSRWREADTRLESASGEIRWEHIDWTKLNGFVEYSGYEGWQYEQVAPPPPAMGRLLRESGTSSDYFHFAGFVFRRQSKSSDDFPSSVVAFPLWAFAAASAILPAVWLGRRLRRKVPVGLCPR